MLPTTIEKETHILVVCIDRDNDLERKANIKGPIIGRKENLNAAEKLALADPGDSDVNAIFKAIQIFDELKRKNKAEVVTLTGDIDVGIVSDRQILTQLDQILKKRKVNEIILITDGAEDEYVLPLIRSRIKDVYTQKIIVKQNNQLEGAYYLMYEFITSILSDKKAANMFIGLPAIAIIIYALFGNAGGRLILGIIGSYLFIKGFQLEHIITKISQEIHISLKVQKSSFFMYLVSIAILILGIFSGYETVRIANTTEIIMNIAYFIQSAAFLLFVSAVLIGIGKYISDKKGIFTQYITYFLLLFTMTWTAKEISSYVLSPQLGYAPTITAILIGGTLVAISSFIEKKLILKKRKQRKNK
ncbi:DUF373 family protein [archaeon]|nr:DUF373 family protein [archaeon]